VSGTLKPYSLIIDFVTGIERPNVGAEENRQVVERYLVNDRGYLKEDIEVDADIELSIDGETYRSQVDLVVTADGGRTRFMAIKCAAGALGSREREILAASRLLDRYQIPVAVVSDGKTAVVLNTVSGKKLAEGLDAIPTKTQAQQRLKHTTLVPFPAERREREALIFRSYDSMNVNVSRKL
jgi:hypothetical protein